MNAALAQLAECQISNLNVAGSIPVGRIREQNVPER